MASPTPDAELVRVWSEYLRDPCRFVKAFWPHIKLTTYQQKILESVRDNPETWVHSANQTGKSFTAALCAIWWFLTRRSKVVITSSSEDQIRGSIWGDVDRLLRTATVNGQHFNFGGIIQTDLELRYADDDGKPIATYSLKCKVTNEVASAQGRHEPKLDDGIGTVLIVVEEGSHLEEEFYNAFSSQAHSLLVVGNPINDQGLFYDKCTAGPQYHPADPTRLFRNVIRVSGEDSPNVKVTKQWKAQGETSEPPCPIVLKDNRLYDPATVKDGRSVDWKVPGILSYEEYVEHMANWTPDVVRTRLLGLFPDEAGQRLFPSLWLDLARDLGRKLAAYNSLPGEQRGRKRFGRPYGVGCDVSEGGGDLTVWCLFGRWGVPYVWNADEHRWEWAIYAKETPDTNEIPGFTLRLMRRFGIRPEAVAFDSGGGGKQIADAMRGKGYDVTDVKFAKTEGVDTDEYTNRRSSLYGELRKAMQPSKTTRMLLELDPAEWRGKSLRCVALPPDDSVLRQDLAVLPMLRDADGRIRLPPKDKRRKSSGRQEATVRELLGGRSPDRGDALTLGYYAWSNAKEERELERVDGPLIW